MSDAPSYDYLTDGAAIYAESFRIIREESDLGRFPDDLAKVVVRMIHAAAQTDLVDDIAWTRGVVASCRAALIAGAPILCDSSMVATGIIRSRLPANNEVVCHLRDERVPALAAEWGTTRSAAAVSLWEPMLAGAVVAIGNAPTALFHLLELIRDGGPRPAVIVGCPVGFIGAAESKAALAALAADHGVDIPFVTVRGRRGGSAITSSALNALASDAE